MSKPTKACLKRQMPFPYLLPNLAFPRQMSWKSWHDSTFFRQGLRLGLGLRLELGLGLRLELGLGLRLGLGLGLGLGLRRRYFHSKRRLLF